MKNSNQTRETLIKQTEKRRENIKDMLNNRKDQKMASKIPAEAQMLQISREDLAFKKELLTKMEESDKKFQESFQALNGTMFAIGAAIQQSVSILGKMAGQENVQIQPQQQLQPQPQAQRQPRLQTQRQSQPQRHSHYPMYQEAANSLVYEEMFDQYGVHTNANPSQTRSSQYPNNSDQIYLENNSCLQEEEQPKKYTSL